MLLTKNPAELKMVDALDAAHGWYLRNISSLRGFSPDKVSPEQIKMERGFTLMNGSPVRKNNRFEVKKGLTSFTSRKNSDLF